MNARAHFIRHYPTWLALLAPLAAAAVMIPLRSHVLNTSLALAMVVVVALVVLPGRRLAALIAGLSAGVWFDFFFTKPYESFSIQRMGFRRPNRRPLAGCRRRGGVLDIDYVCQR